MDETPGGKAAAASRWQTVKAILEQALEIRDAQQRDVFVVAACREDASLLSEVRQLLAFEDAPPTADTAAAPAPSGGGFFAALHQHSSADDPRGHADDAGPPQQMLGPWRLEGEVGRGGMGVVYRAHRADRLYEQQVAVKILDSAMQPSELVRRFEAERRILARLEHPNIARLIDAGVAPDGKRPYFVLEWVDGAPLQGASLDLAAKIRLFLQVCEAVSFAHRQLIVHLDLKPGNIMVKPDGAVKLLDFGLAKLLDPTTGASAGDPTVAVLRVLTPAYASPEQVAGAPLSISSDIYSLGVILYELLTGRKPYDTARAKTQLELARVVAESAPPPTGLGRDIDAIAGMAMEQDPSRRYRSVDALSVDLNRYLRRETVSARPQSATYRLAQFARRNRLLVASVWIGALGLLAGSAIAVQQARIAQRRFDQVRTLANSFLFEFHDAIQNLPGSLEARALVLRRAAEYLDGLERESQGDAGLRRELAQSYLKLGDAQGLYFESNLGEKDAARQSYEKALALLESVASRSLSPMAKVDLAEAHIRVATAYSGAHKSEIAIGHLQQAIAIAQASALEIPPVKIALAKAHFGLAENYERMGRLEAALEQRRTTISILEGASAIAVGKAANLAAQRWLALAHKRYGTTLLNHANESATVDSAIREFTVAETMDRAALSANAANALARADLALDCHYLAAAFTRRNDRPAARQWLQQSLALHREILAQDPKNARARQFLDEDTGALERLSR